MINLPALVLTVSWCVLLLNHEYISDHFLNLILYLAPSIPLYMFILWQGKNDDEYISGDVSFYFAGLLSVQACEVFNNYILK